MRSAAASSHAIVDADSVPYSIARSRGVSARSGRACRTASKRGARRTAMACGCRGISAIRSPVIPYARARQPPQWAFISHSPQRPPSEVRRRMW